MLHTQQHDKGSSEGITAPPIAEASLESNILSVVNNYGTYHFDLERSLDLPYGLIGMPELKAMGLAPLDAENSESPFCILQSVEEPYLTFLVLPLDPINGPIAEKDVLALCRDADIESEDLTLLAIVTIRKIFDQVQITANLQAPICIDAKHRLARQIVMTSNRYNVRHPLTTHDVE